LLRAWQPQAAKPAANNSCEPPQVVRSPEQLHFLIDKTSMAVHVTLVKPGK